MIVLINLEIVANIIDAPKVDMIILLLLVQTENNKFPLSENDGNI